jgi:hypothetical protein
MNETKLKKLLRQIRSLRKRAGSVHDRELVSVAKSLGRWKLKGDGHPNYASDLRSGRITIPSHSKPLREGTALAILDDLETDVFYWKEKLQAAKTKQLESDGP